MKKAKHFCQHITQRRYSDLFDMIVCWDFANFSASAQTHRSSEAYRYRCQYINRDIDIYLKSRNAVIPA